MHQLQMALDEDPELRGQVAALSERIAGNPLKHALILDLNPFWDAARRFEASGVSDDLYYYWYHHRHLPITPPRLPGFMDLTRRYDIAEHLTRETFGPRKRSVPFMLRIFAAPAQSSGDLEFRDRLVAAAREAALPTVVETEERARFVAKPGDQINCGGNSGTLGGFLKDGPAGSTYAVTCGHVVSSGAVSTSAGSLGTCVHAKPPTPLPSSSLCMTGCQHMTKLDVALIDIGAAVPTNSATTQAAVVTRGDLVQMEGAVTGRTTYEIGATVIEIDIAGSCWDRLYLFHAPTSGIFPMAVNMAIRRLPQPGDSGAWLIRNTIEWAGMVVAKGAMHAYALPATVVLRESDQAFGTNLQVA